MSIEVSVDIDVDNLTQSESKDLLSELHDQQATSERIEDFLKDIDISAAIEGAMDRNDSEEASADFIADSIYNSNKVIFNMLAKAFAKIVAEDTQKEEEAQQLVRLDSLSAGVAFYFRDTRYITLESGGQFNTLYKSLADLSQGAMVSKEAISG